MNGAALVAIAATIGNFLQGWDNATIAGAVVYIKKELELSAAIEGLIVAMSLIGATLITTCSGTISDWVGRRPMLICSSMFYFLSGIIMLWSPNVYVLLLARLLNGFGIGLAVTLVPLYISETAPSEIRGLLNTLPQFTGSGGMFLAYCMIFGMSLLASPSWRLMLGVLSIPALLYFALTVFFLPESPRWLVSKGKMLEAKRVLQRLRGRDDVSGEMALLVEGLAVGGETSIEEYIIGPADELDEDQEPTADRDAIKLYGPEEGLSWIAKPVTGQSRLSMASRQGSMVTTNVPLMDPLVTLFGSVHEKLPDMGSMRSMLFPNFGSMFSTVDPNMKNEEWDEESLQREDEGYASDAGDVESDDNLHSPLISRQTTSMEKDGMVPQSHGTVLTMRRHSSLMQGNAGDASSMGIGGGWQLAWKWSEREGEDGKKEGGFKRIYLHEEGGVPGSRRGSLVSLPGDHAAAADGDYIHAAALVSQPALFSKDLMHQRPAGPAMAHPSQSAGKVSILEALLEPGVKRALVVGIGIQILQQFSGINGVLYYTPQILQQAGVDVLLSNLGIGSDSASFLISAVTNLLMLPSIAIAMRFMDVAGRRSLLLTTIPVLVISLIAIVIGNVFDFGEVIHAVVSTVCVVIYFCTFVMGYGPIPNILCSEIFPTRVRGICIAICALVFWICDVIVTYTLPVMLTSIGLAGVFGIYAVVCVVSWIFIFLRVPETKGMPLEVITEFFAVGAKQGVAKNE
ncbi:monosaccharide-sensing protein 2-like [Salvia splendens]|uniref:monosaccharide-sensing protein 2-like n=1 Tax=Salvia splendens TaxID=180675 RepID=UPI001C2693C2|nr:monosaccharide-sensing protein 2-like [Salvia splendens]XP_042017492.1 monosaccharide-sensing protein 2-like [Salvia splendens]XP_042017493.1 monosaccharide-sensing protein 2-like [Salvia splendens]XP_042017494.1 monosaccharide-sensing protein 2-like [Salvia splendens]